LYKRQVTWRLLAGNDAGSVEFREIAYERGAASTPAGESLRHRGLEFGTVVEGQLTLEIAGEELVLGVGDSVVFDSAQPHRFRNDGAAPCRAIWFIRVD
jgi:mannose-6-phosphate isomerase-like protein (cupin superfamily)